MDPGRNRGPPGPLFHPALRKASALPAELRARTYLIVKHAGAFQLALQPVVAWKIQLDKLQHNLINVAPPPILTGLK